jgi:hypothetical protein
MYTYLSDRRYTNARNARYSDNGFNARFVPGGDGSKQLIDQLGSVKAIGENKGG